MKKKVALITGGSRGIGLAISRRLYQDGWFIAVNYNRSKHDALALAEEIHGLAVGADISDEKQVSAMFNHIREAHGHVSLLVNNAGIAHYGLLQDTTPEKWRRVFAVNVDGAYHCCRMALPQMIANQAGSIVNVASIWGQTGAACEVAYSASKAALIGMTKALAKEVGPSGVRVNCVSPGCIETDMLGSLSPRDLDELIRQTPVSRLGAAEDVAEMVAFLANDHNQFITGQVLGVNGGLLI